MTKIGPAPTTDPIGKWAFFLFPALAFALNWPYIGGGFFGDDLILLNLFREGGAPPWWRGVWSALDVPCFRSLWWVGSFGEGGFWRPLPSLLLQGSLGLFGTNAIPLHVLSILLHGANAWLVFVLGRRLLSDSRIALLAGLFFLACEDLSMVVGWVATITDVLGTFFALVALLAHIRWLERRRGWYLTTSLLALVLALGCKESAVAVPLLMFGLTWLSAGRLRAAAADRLSWIPSFALLAGYLAAYVSLGFGSGASLVYTDPFRQPAAFLAHAASRIPLTFLGAVSIFPPSLALFQPSIVPAAAILGAAFLGLFLLALWPLRREPAVLWALPSFAAALLPQMGAEGGERALYLPLVPASILLAILAARGWPLARRLLPGLPRPPAVTRIAGTWCIFGVLVPGVALCALYAPMLRVGFERPGREIATLASLVRERSPLHVVVLNTSGPGLTLYLRDELVWQTGQPIDTHVLSSLNGVVTLERTGERSFVLRTDRRGWLTNLFALLLRTSRKLHEGQTFSRQPFTATILELDARKDFPDALAVRFDLAGPSGDPGILLAAWDGAAFVPVDLEELPPGERRKLADTSDVWASMK